MTALILLFMNLLQNYYIIFNSPNIFFAFPTPLKRAFVPFLLFFVYYFSYLFLVIFLIMSKLSYIRLSFLNDGSD